MRGVWGSEDIGVYYSGSEDCQIMLWDAATGKQASLLRRLVYYRSLPQRLRGRRSGNVYVIYQYIYIYAHTHIYKYT